MIKEIEKELKKAQSLSKLNRRDFMRVLSAAGLMTVAGTQKAKAFSSSVKGKIVIIGGGAAGLSMGARLSRWLENPDITLIDPSDRQYFQPGFTLIAGGVFQPDEIWKPQASCIPEGVKWVKDSVVAIDPQHNIITTSKNGKIDYDFMVLTPGIQINWEKIEGMSLATLGQGNAHSTYDFEGSQKVWKAMDEFSSKGGKGIFVDTYTKIKCGGVPKKITLLTEHNLRKKGMRDHATLNYYTASSKLYSVPFYTKRLQQIYDERHVDITTNTRVKGVDTQAKTVYFEQILEKNGQKEVIPFKEDYDFFHFAPPMSAPDFVREAGLGWTEGKFKNEAWVMVDQQTLVHKTYPNIVSLGDVSGIPTSKTSAAVRMQVPVAAKNLISLMEGKEPKEIYDGYACCPIVTDYGHVLLCEFDYNKNPEISFPFSLLDMSKEQYAAWLLKVYALKPMYFYAMIKGLA